MSDKISVIKTIDGRVTFELISPWVVPASDPFRAAMTSTVRIANDEFVMVVRRRVVSDGDSCWVDCYKSDDGAENWYSSEFE